MAQYEFLERINVFYYVEAESEEDAWKKFEKIKPPYKDTKNTSLDIMDCYINNID